MSATTKPLESRAPLQAATDEARNAQSEVNRLSSLAESLKTEHAGHVQSGKIDDPATIKAIVEIGAKLLMVPAALERAKEAFDTAKAKLPDLCAALALEAKEFFTKAREEGLEDWDNSLSAHVSPDRRRQVAATVFLSTNAGANLHEAGSLAGRLRFEALNEQQFFTVERVSGYLELADMVEQIQADRASRS